MVTGVLPNKDQKESIQKLAYFLGVSEYNSQNYKDAITYFSYGNQYQINSTYSFLINFWLADSYYQLGNYQQAISLYGYFLNYL